MIKEKGLLVGLNSKVSMIVEFAKEKKSLYSVVLDLRKIANFCDFFVILTGTSKPHIRAIADGINEGLSGQGVKAHHCEGYHESKWVVLDYADVIVHIFDNETRSFYDLEHLWADAPKVGHNKKRKQGGK